jgi:hypothetical protein
MACLEPAYSVPGFRVAALNQGRLSLATLFPLASMRRVRAPPGHLWETAIDCREIPPTAVRGEVGLSQTHASPTHPAVVLHIEDNKSVARAAVAAAHRQPIT